VGAGVALGIDPAIWLGPFWGGLAFRVFEGLERTHRSYQPYAEVGVYLFVNVGAGATLRLEPSGPARLGPHLFFGLPLPLDGGPDFAAEPYYRPSYWPEGTTHEAGVLLKWLVPLVEGHRGSATPVPR
jgi:hypothetical protein